MQGLMKYLPWIFFQNQSLQVLQQRVNKVESVNVKFDENLQNSIAIDGYVSNEPDYREMEEIDDEQEVQNEEEEAQEKTPKTPRYVQNNHSKDQIIGDKRKGVLTKSKDVEVEVNLCLLFEVEPKSISEACKDEHWMNFMEN